MFNIELEVLASVVRQQKEINCLQISKEPNKETPMWDRLWKTQYKRASRVTLGRVVREGLFKEAAF